MSDRCYKRWIRKQLKERWMVQGTIMVRWIMLAIDHGVFDWVMDSTRDGWGNNWRSDGWMQAMNQRAIEGSMDSASDRSGGNGRSDGCYKRWINWRSDGCYKRWNRKQLKERWLMQGTNMGAIEGDRSGGNWLCDGFYRWGNNWRSDGWMQAIDQRAIEGSMDNASNQSGQWK